MSKVTSKLQVTLPKALAQQLGISPGDQISWEIAGEALRVVPVGKRRRDKSDVQAKLRLFDQATRRQQKRSNMIAPVLLETAKYGRGWTREDLYSRPSQPSAGSQEMRSPKVPNPTGAKNKSRS